MTGLVLEAEHQWAEDWDLRAGVGWDHAATPESGDKEKTDSFNAPAFNLRLTRQLDSQSELYVSGSRRSRFPSLRELYSGALGRFVPNPDLKPERQDLLEAGLMTSSSSWNLSAAAFWQVLHDGIEKETVPGPDRQFKRVNRTSIRVPGVELAGAWRLQPNLELTAQHTVMNARVENDGQYNQPAEDRPDYLSHLALSYHGFTGPAALVEAALTGPRWSADATDEQDGLKRLPAAIRWNLRLSWTWEMGGPVDLGGREVEAHLRLDNVFDQWTDFQVGLPEPGRMLSGGLMIRM